MIPKTKTSQKTKNALLDQETFMCSDVSPALVAFIRNCMKKPMDPRTLAEKKEKYKAVPGNMADFLKETKINTEL